MPLPVTVICELLGVPAADRNDFRRWAKAIVSTVPPDVARESERSVSAYLTALIDAKRVSPADDLLSDLVHQTGAGGSLWPDELVRMAFLLLVAGLEKMVSLIGNGVLALLQHPAELGTAAPAPGVLAAIESADLIVLGPSNPVAGLLPILGLPGVTKALEQRRDRVVAVSSVVASITFASESERRRGQARAAAC